ncbi:MAG: hypothetical protein Q7J44_14070 [Pseudotabrizicola sp.]|uniref:hypothetical protein n=1 Tax=Pseudotabrizicola sp. TaxID=2939647 RepID=UPI0027200904|nr:hypothetical protein [Pseudotabrizicola sp.]MDO9639662.1 hypothetical protein [Pseudotabrizicola sp.]
MVPAVLAEALVIDAMVEEVAERRKYWFAGSPTELDLYAARKAVSRRLKISLETVEAMLAAPLPPSGEA